MIETIAGLLGIVELLRSHRGRPEEAEQKTGAQADTEPGEPEQE